VRQDDVVQVADGVFWVRGALVNWYLLEDGRDLALVDTGYPGDAEDVEASIALTGHRPEDVRASTTRRGPSPPWTTSRLDADVVLPGHGPAHRGPVRDAVAPVLDAEPGRRRSGPPGRQLG
jgi:glyoxylase-like metal-dependent hydrolase (beta-lactamase superfamily II)